MLFFLLCFSFQDLMLAHINLNASILCICIYVHINSFQFQQIVNAFIFSHFFMHISRNFCAFTAAFIVFVSFFMNIFFSFYFFSPDFYFFLLVRWSVGFWREWRCCVHVGTIKIVCMHFEVRKINTTWKCLLWPKKIHQKHCILFTLLQSSRCVRSV